MSTLRSRVTAVAAVPAGPSGIRDHGRLLANALRRLGAEVEETWFQNDARNLVDAVRLSAGLTRLGTTLRRSSTVLWHYNPVSHSYRGVPGPGVLVGALLRARGCRVVTMIHELAYSRSASPGWRPLVKAVAQRMALELVLLGSSDVVVSTDLRRAWLGARRFGFRRPVHVVPVFTTVPVAFPPTATTEGTFTLGVLGYSGDGVRPDVLVDALRQLVPHARALLIGAPGPDSPDGRKWNDLARSAGLDEYLEFTGVIDAEVFSRCLQQCSLIVLVNEEGPSSRKTTLAAALAHGLPVVSLDGPNRWDALSDAGVMRLVRGPVELRKAIQELQASAAERSALGSRGRLFYDERMSLESAAATFAALLGVEARHT